MKNNWVNHHGTPLGPSRLDLGSAPTGRRQPRRKLPMRPALHDQDEDEDRPSPSSAQRRRASTQDHRPAPSPHTRRGERAPPPPAPVRLCPAAQIDGGEGRGWRRRTLLGGEWLISRDAHAGRVAGAIPFLLEPRYPPQAEVFSWSGCKIFLSLLLQHVARNYIQSYIAAPERGFGSIRHGVQTMSGIWLCSALVQGREYVKTPLEIFKISKQTNIFS